MTFCSHVSSLFLLSYSTYSVISLYFLLPPHFLVLVKFLKISFCLLCCCHRRCQPPFINTPLENRKGFLLMKNFQPMPFFTFHTFTDIFENITWRITLLIRALTEDVKVWLVPWKYQRTIPPLLKIVNKSNILVNFTWQMVWRMYYVRMRNKVLNPSPTEGNISFY